MDPRSFQQRVKAVFVIPREKWEACSSGYSEVVPPHMLCLEFIEPYLIAELFGASWKDGRAFGVPSLHEVFGLVEALFDSGHEDLHYAGDWVVSNLVTFGLEDPVAWRRAKALMGPKTRKEVRAYEEGATRSPDQDGAPSGEP